MPKSGMQMMIESMLPPGFLDKLQQEFIPFIQSLDERLNNLQALEEQILLKCVRVESECSVISARVESAMAKFDPSYVEPVTAILQHLLESQSTMGVHDNG